MVKYGVKETEEKRNRWKTAGKWAVMALAIAGVAGAGYIYFGTVKEMEKNADEMAAKISELHDQNLALEDELYKEQQKNSDFQSQIGRIAGTVGRLDKLSQTDKELLQKYSKVYFLNENYIPSDLSAIPGDEVFNKKREEKVHTKVLPFLQNMMADAKNQGIDLEIISAYRSFQEQMALKSSYTVTYGSGANKFSADQGYSEHQLGTTVDLTTSQLGSAYTGFKKDAAYKWMQENAYKYGFMLSYPEGNSYYQFEPWHWRFVGKSLANYLHQEKSNFYDLDQRKIDAYLINIFD